MRIKLVKLLFACSFMLCFVSGLAAQKRVTHREYIDKFRQWAIDDQQSYGIPASITMAQGLLESDSGNSRLATQANNHFGIKCKAEWTGMTITHDDDAIGECFRKYSSAADSYKDHSEFLDKSPRYQALFELDITDYKGWARGLQTAGYATNKQYATLLIKIIEDNELYLLDELGEKGAVLIADDLTEAEPKRGVVAISDVESNTMYSIREHKGYKIYINNGAEFLVAKQADTYSSIAEKMNIPEKRLRKFNDASQSYEPQQGELVYVKAKGRRADNGRFIHVVTQGETLHSISQKYGVKLKQLSRMNNTPINKELKPRLQIRLR